MSDISLGGQTTANDRTTIHSVQSVGKMSLLLQHQSLVDAGYDAGGGIYLTGFKLESSFLDDEQLLDNSKIVPLLNGDTITLTNSNMSGSVTFSCTRTGAGIADGDVVKISQFLKQIGDSVGGTLIISYELNGTIVTTTLYNCTVKRVPAIKLAGNDLPDYAVVWNYSHYFIEGDDVTING